MAMERLAPAEARATAGALVAALASRRPATLALGDIDLAPALEQQLFFALRDSAAERSDWRRRADHGIAFGRIAAAAGAAIIPRRHRAPPPNPIVVLIRTPARFAVLDPIDRALEQLGGEPMAVIHTGGLRPSRGPRLTSARLSDMLLPSSIAGLAKYPARVRRDLRTIAGSWGPLVGPGRARALQAVASRELPRIALAAKALESVVLRWRPSLLIGFDEVGTWSRILPAVARAEGVPSLNLPHAEADDAAGLAGVTYDRFAVFGPRATLVLRTAGIPSDRIVEVGAPQFDGLISRGPLRAPADTELERAHRPLILLAAQYVQGPMTMPRLEACHRVAIAAAAAVAPSELVVLPHPLQPPGLIQGIVGRSRVPDGVVVRVEQELRLHDLLDRSWLLVTGWSTSVLEAALRDVPSMMVDPDHVSPLPYAAEGLAFDVGDETAARRVARSLRDPAIRTAAIQRARDALTEHLGPLDGRSSERAARLILSTAGRKVDAGVRDRG